MTTIFYGFVGVLLALVILCAFIALKVTWKLTHPTRKPLDMDPKDFGLDHAENVRFSSREAGITLAGWYFSAEQQIGHGRQQTLIFSHGYSQNRQEPHLPALSLAARLVHDGYDVLMFDFRNAGESSDALTTIGLREQQDLLGAIDFAQSKKPEHALGLVGFSMGAATSLLVGGVDDRIRAIVADSPFYSLKEYLEENLPKWTGLPPIPFNWFILTLSPIMLGANPRDVKPYQAVQQANKPIFFIHGTGDDTIASKNSERLLDLATDGKSSLWLVPMAGHVRSYAKYPDEYGQKVIGFFNEALQVQERKKQLRE
jgi:uncharacterized protein